MCLHTPPLPELPPACPTLPSGIHGIKNNFKYCTDTTYSLHHTSQAPSKRRDQGGHHALQNISKSVIYVFCMFFSQKFLGLLQMLQNFKNSLHLLEILRTILQYCHCLPISSQNMGPKRRDLGNVTCPTLFRRVV